MKIKREKRRYFLCPVCKKRHDNIPKTKELEVFMIVCECGCGSIIQVKNGYHIPSKNGVEMYK